MYVCTYTHTHTHTHTQQAHPTLALCMLCFHPICQSEYCQLLKKVQSCFLCLKAVHLNDIKCIGLISIRADGITVWFSFKAQHSKRR